MLAQLHGVGTDDCTAISLLVRHLDVNLGPRLLSEEINCMVSGYGRSPFVSQIHKQLMLLSCTVYHIMLKFTQCRHSQDQTTRIVKDLQAPVIEASLHSLLNDQVELGL